MEDSAPAAPVPTASAPSMPQSGDDRLISDVTAQATASVLSTLSAPRGGGGQETMIGNGARTLESMVLEIIRPALKDWLDRNLPGLVERIVTKEVRKITRDIG
ncbi:MAG: DUF2497 domain-containing protein [Proteobacteria bacterium]|nr:DUF2497 domain-containing protein [Pseudomonadota bacterium]